MSTCQTTPRDQKGRFTVFQNGAAGSPRVVTRKTNDITKTTVPLMAVIGLGLFLLSAGYGLGATFKAIAIDRKTTDERLTAVEKEIKLLRQAIERKKIARL